MTVVCKVWLYYSLKSAEQKTHYAHKMVFLCLLRYKFEKSLEICLFSVFRELVLAENFVGINFREITQNSRKYAKPWTYNWGWLATLLSIFLFMIHLFISLDLSVYTLTIYRWLKIRAWCVFWLSINEMQPWNFIGKNHNPIFFSFLSLVVCETDLQNLLRVCNLFYLP